MTIRESSLPVVQRPGPGRPRGFDPSEAVAAALELFWRQGYQATSLDDLTSAMGLSRSSFYACFGAKRAVLLHAVRAYAKDGLATLAGIESAEREPADAVRTMVRTIANPDGGSRGCLLVNCITELAPHDAELAALARSHIERIERIIARLLAKDGGRDAAPRARALIALTIGAITLRKAGIGQDSIDAVLVEAEKLIAPPPVPPA